MLKRLFLEIVFLNLIVFNIDCICEKYTKYLKLRNVNFMLTNDLQKLR